MEFEIIAVIVILVSIAIPLAIGRIQLKIERVEDDRDRTKETLAEGMARFERLAKNIPGAIYQYEIQPNGRDRIVYISERARDICECDPQELLRDSGIIWQMIHPADLARICAIDFRSIASHEPFDLEFRIVVPSGRVKWIHTTSFAQIYNNSEMVWDGIAIDITARKQAEAEAQARSDHFQLLFETTRDLLSTDRPLTLVDNLFAKLQPLVGLDVYINYLVDEEQQMLNLAFSGGIPADVVAHIKWLEIGCAVCGMVAKERQQIVQSDVQNSTDPKTALIRALGLSAYSCQPLIAQGKLFGTLGFGSRTRTAFSTAETKLFQALCDQIAIALDRSALVASLQQQAEDLRQLNRLKDEFLAALSHELRTPLNPILGWTMMMRSRQLSPQKVSEALAIVERNIRQQISLVDDLLDVASSFQGKLNLHLQPVDLGQAVDRAISTLTFAAEAKNLTIDRLGLPALHLLGDRDRLQQVCWNLISNAIKFTPAGGRVTVELLELSTKEAQIRISDNGIGIDRQFLPYVFDYFRQADGSVTRAYGGLGLGLPLVRHLIELHGGTVTADSPGVGTGSTFVVTIPIRSITTALVAPADGAVPLQIPSSHSKLQILLVDDDPDDLELLRYVLQEDGSIVTAVASPLAALDRLHERMPDLLVSDIFMPEMNGYELLDRIRNLPNGDRLPVMALTASDRPEDREAALSAGFNAYIAKPVDPIQLLSSLAQLVLDGL